MHDTALRHPDHRRRPVRYRDGLPGAGRVPAQEHRGPRAPRAARRTWDLFRYPGIRSDSDMLTFGYKWRPWHERKVLADGPSIREYIADTAAEYGVDEKIQYG